MQLPEVKKIDADSVVTTVEKTAVPPADPPQLEPAITEPVKASGQTAGFFEPTARKPEYGENDPEDGNGPQLNPEDFDQGDDTTDPPDAGKDGKVKAEVIDINVYRSSAEDMVASLDLIGQIGFPLLYKWKKFKPGDYKKAWHLHRKYEAAQKSGAEEKFTVPEMQLIMDFIKVKEWVENVAFKEKEKQQLIEPLTKICQKHNITFGSEYRLIIALVAVLGARFAPMAIDM